MALHKKPTSDQIRDARKGGYRTKRPRKPKAGASLTVLENWETRYNDWCKGITEGASNGKKRENLKREISKR